MFCCMHVGAMEREINYTNWLTLISLTVAYVNQSFLHGSMIAAFCVGKIFWRGDASLERYRHQATRGFFL